MMTLMARYSMSPSDLLNSIAGMVFQTRVTISPLCRPALSCWKSSYPLRVKRWVSVRWISWMQMMSTPSLFRNSCSLGFFFRSPSAFHCVKTSGTADVSGLLDKLLAGYLLFSSCRSRWAPWRLGARHCHYLVFHRTSTIPPYVSLHDHVWKGA